MSQNLSIGSRSSNGSGSGSGPQQQQQRRSFQQQPIRIQPQNQGQGQGQCGQQQQQPCRVFLPPINLSYGMPMPSPYPCYNPCFPGCFPCCPPQYPPPCCPPPCYPPPCPPPCGPCGPFPKPCGPKMCHMGPGPGCPPLMCLPRRAPQSGFRQGPMNFPPPPFPFPPPPFEQPASFNNCNFYVKEPPVGFGSKMFNSKVIPFNNNNNKDPMDGNECIFPPPRCEQDFSDSCCYPPPPCPCPCPPQCQPQCPPEIAITFRKGQDCTPFPRPKEPEEPPPEAKKVPRRSVATQRQPPLAHTTTQTDHIRQRHNQQQVTPHQPKTKQIGTTISVHAKSEIIGTTESLPGGDMQMQHTTAAAEGTATVAGTAAAQNNIHTGTGQNNTRAATEQNATRTDNVKLRNNQQQIAVNARSKAEVQIVGNRRPISPPPPRIQPTPVPIRRSPPPRQETQDQCIQKCELKCVSLRPIKPATPYKRPHAGTIERKPMSEVPCPPQCDLPNQQQHYEQPNLASIPSRQVGMAIRAEARSEISIGNKESIREIKPPPPSRPPTQIQMPPPMQPIQRRVKSPPPARPIPIPMPQMPPMQQIQPTVVNSVSQTRNVIQGRVPQSINVDHQHQHVHNIQAALPAPGFPGRAAPFPEKKPVPVPRQETQEQCLQQCELKCLSLKPAKPANPYGRPTAGSIERKPMPEAPCPPNCNIPSQQQDFSAQAQPSIASIPAFVAQSNKQIGGMALRAEASARSEIVGTTDSLRAIAPPPPPPPMYQPQISAQYQPEFNDISDQSSLASIPASVTPSQNAELTEVRSEILGTTESLRAIPPPPPPPIRIRPQPQIQPTVIQSTSRTRNVIQGGMPSSITVDHQHLHNVNLQGALTAPAPPGRPIQPPFRNSVPPRTENHGHQDQCIQNCDLKCHPLRPIRPVSPYKRPNAGTIDRKPINEPLCSQQCEFPYRQQQNFQGQQNLHCAPSYTICRSNNTGNNNKLSPCNPEFICLIPPPPPPTKRGRIKRKKRMLPEC